MYPNMVPPPVYGMGQLPPPAMGQLPPPIMGAPVVEGSPYTYFHPGQPMDQPPSRGYTLYDPNHGSSASVPQSEPQSVDEFQAKLDALKKL